MELLFDLFLYVPSTIFQLCRDESSLVEPELSIGLMRLAQRHNAVTPVRLYGGIKKTSYTKSMICIAVFQ